MADTVEDINSKIEKLEKSIGVIERSDNAQVKKLFWFKLALLYSKRKDENSLNKSSTCLQNCLRLDRRDDRVWQSLGEVYFARGSYVSAVKAFQMAIQTRASKVEGSKDEYAELRIAECHRVLGLLDDAFVEYSDLLSRSPDSVPALVGLALSKLSLADDHFRRGQHDKAFPVCSEVIELSEKVSKVRSDLSLPFSLISYCCLLALLNTENRTLNLHYNGQVLSRIELIEFGRKNLKTALKIHLNLAPLWNNLAIYEYIQFKLDANERHKQIAIKSSLKAIELDRKNSSYWNTLGVISSRINGGKQLSLHCFLKSMAICKSTLEIPWTNLAILTCDSKCPRPVVDHCFANAQAQEPAFTNLWVTQVLSRDSTD
ncbi:Tetratricopeptide repeat protein 37 [Halotydeus destructor]|nr:Tetratricopeptide repeat protein 37 [Halotydeus destructor]